MRLKLEYMLRFDGFLCDFALENDVLYALADSHRMARGSRDIFIFTGEKQTERFFLKDDDDLNNLVVVDDKIFAGGHGKVYSCDRSFGTSEIVTGNYESPGVLVASDGKKAYALDGTYHDIDEWCIAFTAHACDLEDNLRTDLGLYKASARRYRAVAACDGQLYIGLVNQLYVVSGETIAFSHNFGVKESYRTIPRVIKSIIPTKDRVYVALNSEVYNEGNIVSLVTIENEKIKSEIDVDLPINLTNGKKNWVEKKRGALDCMAFDGENFFLGSNSGHLVYGRLGKFSTIDPKVGAISRILAADNRLYVGSRYGRCIAVFNY